jgi:hypothetical protein
VEASRIVDPAPSTGSEIRAALETLHAESVQYWSAMGTATFLAPLGVAWSPAENVRHLTKSVRAVTQGLRVPRIMLLFRFGRAGHPSRSYETMRETYRARLAQGAAAGRFGPGARPASNANADPEAERAQIMAYHATAVRGLSDAISAWPERALDGRQLPHPLLGKLTVREMLLFTLYHNRHHLDGVRRRMTTAGAS